MIAIREDKKPVHKEAIEPARIVRSIHGREEILKRVIASLFSGEIIPLGFN